MNSERLFKIIGQIDESLVEEAEIIKPKKPKYNQITRYSVIAACVVLVISISAFLLKHPNILPIQNSPVNDTLPKLTIEMDFGAMGFEGYCAYKIEDLVNENPWNEKSNLTQLPVIKNKLLYSQKDHQIKNPDINAMESLLKDTARKLGLDADHLPITNDIPDEKTKDKITEKFEQTNDKVPEGYFNVSRLFMQDKNIKIEVNTTMEVTVDFEPAVSLPKEYQFKHSSTYDQMYKVAEYLLEQYRDYINMQNPKINISGGDHTYQGDQMYSISFFDDTGDELQKLLNYHFHSVTFACDDEGKLFISRTYKTDISDVIGNYPIISKDEAEKLLINKNYLTSVPEVFPGKKYIKKCELIYRNDYRSETFLPYYRFYVEMPSMKLKNGLNTYGAYYVPAIDQRYIKNMPKNGALPFN